MDNYISQIINTKINFMKSSFEVNKTVNHQGIKGSLNETLFLELIRDLVPQKYKLTKGIIQDKVGFQSNESDIVLYDNEILPALLFGLELSFVPCEAVEYTFEIKSSLNSNELDTTIKKFENLKKCKGYMGRNVLFSFSSDLKDKPELKRYYEKDKSFLTKPSITAFCIQNKCYYFFLKKKIYIRDLISKKDFFNSIIQKDDKETITLISPDIEKKELINNVKYEDIYFTYYSWAGIEILNDNCNLLGLLSGISNTLCKKKFGNYLLSSCNENYYNFYSEYAIDMWGNVSYENIDFEGFKNSVLNSFRFSLTQNQYQNTNNLTILTGNNK